MVIVSSSSRALLQALTVQLMTGAMPVAWEPSVTAVSLWTGRPSAGLARKTGVRPGLNATPGCCWRKHPQLIVAFHDQFDPGSGGTSDMCLRGLLKDVPVWLVRREDPGTGSWLRLNAFPERRADRVRRELGISSNTPGLFET